MPVRATYAIPAMSYRNEVLRDALRFVTPKNNAPMKLGRNALIACTCHLAMAAHAQITLTEANNLPVVGATFVAHRGNYVAPEPGGAGLLFNFNTSLSTSVVNYQWQDPASLPNGAQFPAAELALTNGGADTVFTTATTSGMERIGDTQTILIDLLAEEFHFATAYSDPMLELALPISYNDAPWTDLFSGTFTVDGTSATRNGSITGQADAWGYLIVPGGADTVEVVRVNTRITETIPLNISGILITANHVRNTHAYYPMWGKYPLLSTVSDSLTSMLLNQYDHYTEWLDATAVGVQEQRAAGLRFELSPNPTADLARVIMPATAKGPVELTVTDLHGAVVARRSITGRSTLIQTGAWPVGVYQLVFTDREGQCGVERLVVAH